LQINLYEGTSLFQQNNNLLDKQENIGEIFAVLGIYAKEIPRTAKMSQHGISLPSLNIIFIHWTLPFAQKTLKEHKS
jgi:hypothetical protein